MKLTESKHLYELFSIDQGLIDIEDPKSIEACYHKFVIPKKNGGERHIFAPNDILKEVQKKIKKMYLETINVSENAHGFVSKRSIVTNAKFHVNQCNVYNIDLKDFFPSISIKRVYKIFNKMLKMNSQISIILSNICTLNRKLPQGAPTSPIISNIVSLNLDKRLAGYARKNNLNYTRYADDITFSGNRVTSFDRKIIKHIILNEGFQINYTKERLYKSDNRQIVTGLIVNDKLSVNKELIDELKNAIYYARKFGIANHMLKVGISNSFYKEHLYGKAYFIRMINHKLGESMLDNLDDIDWPY